jgi:hypothetical protein
MPPHCQMLFLPPLFASNAADLLSCNSHIQTAPAVQGILYVNDKPQPSSEQPPCILARLLQRLH